MAISKYHYEFHPSDGTPGSATVRVVTTEGDCGPDLTYQGKRYLIPHDSNLFQRKFTETDVVPEGVSPVRCLCVGPTQSRSACEVPSSSLYYAELSSPIQVAPKPPSAGDPHSYAVPYADVINQGGVRGAYLSITDYPCEWAISEQDLYEDVAQIYDSLEKTFYPVVIRIAGWQAYEPGTLGGGELHLHESPESGSAVSTVRFKFYTPGDIYYGGQVSFVASGENFEHGNFLKPFELPITEVIFNSTVDIDIVDAPTSIKFSPVY